MPCFRFVCLANSRKHGGRCVAGIRTDGEGWVRLVGDTPSGALSSNQCLLANGGKARVLDVIEVVPAAHAPKAYQRENWLVGRDRWRLAARPASSDDLEAIRNHIVAGPALFGDVSDRLTLSRADGSSLVLVRAADLRWRITRSRGGQRQTRARFTLAGQAYDLPLTDDTIEKELLTLEPGEYPIEAAPRFFPGTQTLITVSLGEPYELDNRCYKLAATVFPDPFAGP